MDKTNRIRFPIMTDHDAANALTPFGFTGLESEIYAFLAGESTATGYRIAQAIGKPVANTYKAIHTLQAKGAIIVEEGESRLCRAVPSDELLDRLGRDFEKSRQVAKRALQQIRRTDVDDRLYTIRATSQALQRARQMLDSAEQIVLLAARADLVRALADELANAATRGVEVFIKTEREVAINRAEVYVVRREDDLLHHAPYLRLTVDGRQHLGGRVDSDDVADIVWSQNAAFSLMSHEGLAAEISVLAVAERIEDGAGAKRVAKALNQAMPASRTLGATSR